MASRSVNEPATFLTIGHYIDRLSVPLKFGKKGCTERLTCLDCVFVEGDQKDIARILLKVV